MAITKKVLGEEHPDFAASLNNLAILKYNQKQYNESLGLITSAHKIFQKTLGADHPNTKKTLEGIKTIEKTLSDMDESPKQQKHTSIYRRLLGRLFS
jgi:hypothetical protein